MWSPALASDEADFRCRASAIIKTKLWVLSAWFARSEEANTLRCQRVVVGSAVDRDACFCLYLSNTAEHSLSRHKRLPSESFLSSLFLEKEIQIWLWKTWGRRLYLCAFAPPSIVPSVNDTSRGYWRKIMSADTNWYLRSQALPHRHVTAAGQ